VESTWAEETSVLKTPSEDQAVLQILDRMAVAFPTVRREHVRQVVAQAHEGFAGDPIRAYVPVLVERKAKMQLRIETQPLVA
jgi:hypothetical protein